MGIERRIHPRLETIDLVSFENYETTKTELMQGMGKTVDLSIGGMCFLSKYALPLGSMIKISLALGENVFEAEGKIVSLNLTGDLQVKIHVQFSQVSEKQRAILESYLADTEEDKRPTEADTDQ
jgi:c-di-GMP-binding flagellar brake protein YcgR